MKLLGQAMLTPWALMRSPVVIGGRGNEGTGSHDMADMANPEVIQEVNVIPCVQVVEGLC